MARPKRKTGKPIMCYPTPEEREALERGAERLGMALSHLCLRGALRLVQESDTSKVGGRKKPAKRGRKGT